MDLTVFKITGHREDWGLRQTLINKDFEVAVSVPKHFPKFKRKKHVLAPAVRLQL